ncbi:glycine zipper 2TM domain-containing protein [Collimonas silvisoli]|uniref:glycine zipper 2TM domain-containing protein n=1 Tax=Collimonas silvisoli TaxID=2825884 RepID=UPI0022A70967|nr:glycine zipper 2TM domain-containing protein [Collimonas silvisoli]
MEAVQATTRLHPLVAGAAATLILASLVGVAAMTGLLPSSHGSVVGSQAPETTPAAQQPMANAAAPTTPATGAPVLVQTANGYQYMQPVTVPVAAGYQVEPAATAPKQKTIVHHVYRNRDASYAQAGPAPQYQAPVAQASPAAPASPQVSPLGIATGAVIGGLLGHQVGGGNGRTLATVAGVVGGGYLGNTVAKNYGY